jgi:hypothetical protein
LLIPVASDELVHDTFKILAQHWYSQAREESLELEGGLTVAPGVTTPTPAHVQKILDADCWIIGRARVQLIDLTVSDWRASGHGGFRTGLLKELRIDMRDGCDFPAELVAEVLAFTWERLHATYPCATPHFAHIANQMRSDMPAAAMSFVPAPRVRR